MKQRCSNPKNKNFSYYGARGVRVCERWLSFDHFLDDMGERPAGLTLDRIDNDGDYEPGNCQWSTPKAQIRNSRGARPLKDGAFLADLATSSGVSYDTLYQRRLRGWSDDKLAQPV